VLYNYSRSGVEQQSQKLHSFRCAAITHVCARTHNTHTHTRTHAHTQSHCCTVICQTPTEAAHRQAKHAFLTHACKPAPPLLAPRDSLSASSLFPSFLVTEHLFHTHVFPSRCQQPQKFHSCCANPAHPAPQLQPAGKTPVHGAPCLPHPQPQPQGTRLRHQLRPQGTNLRDSASTSRNHPQGIRRSPMEHMLADDSAVEALMSSGFSWPITCPTTPIST